MSLDLKLPKFIFTVRTVSSRCCGAREVHGLVRQPDIGAILSLSDLIVFSSALLEHALLEDADLLFDGARLKPAAYRGALAVPRRTWQRLIQLIVSCRDYPRLAIKINTLDHIHLGELLPGLLIFRHLNLVLLTDLGCELDKAHGCAMLIFLLRLRVTIHGADKLIISEESWI